MKKRSLLEGIWYYIKFSILVFLGFTTAGVISYRFIPVPFTYLMIQRMSEQMTTGKKVGIVHHWVPMNKISMNMVQAAVASEDNNFMHHFGIDYDAIGKAYEHNKHGRKIRGASTISQQTSKNVFLWINRTYFRKGLEVYFTYMIEIFWGKQRIMEVYLNSIEMGDGIFGVEAASERYFHKHAINLTEGEAALIAAAFPNPRKRNPSNPNGYLVQRQQTILGLMHNIPKVEF